MMALYVSAALAVPGAQGGTEDRRLDPTEFRKGLKERGLTELLELYLNEVPPADPIEALLLERDIRLAQSADPTRPRAERYQALIEANHLLERLLAEHPADLRVFEWRVQLGRSLLYQEAEPFYSSILYRGGTTEDRRQLAAVMERAQQLFGRLRLDLAREQDRLDRISPREYEELERSGYLERLEGIGPQADYLDRWVRFYRALAREPDDPVRNSELGAVLDDLKNRSGLLDTPHGITHVQAQSQLLAGMAARQLGDHGAAVGYLEAAANTVRRIGDAQEKQDSSWVMVLALLETVRADRDGGRFERALQTLREFETQLEAAPSDALGLRLVLALAESSVRQEQARRARAAGDKQAAATFENMRFEPLTKFARQGTSSRDQVYATLYETLDPAARPTDLHPFEGCALLAGLLNRAAALAEESAAARAAGELALSSRIEDLESRRIAVLDRAVEVAQFFYVSAARVPPDLVPEIIYNLGVAQLQRGRRLEAARAFLTVAREHRHFPQAQLAATAAVQVAWELAEDPSLRDRSDLRTLCLEALQVLTENFPHTDDARYWQFFLAQVLHDLGRYDEAVEAFSRVDPAHEYYVHAEFLRTRSLAAALRGLTAEAPADATELLRRVAAVVDAADAFLRLADAARAKGFDETLLQGFLAEAELFAAEALLDLGKEQSPKALARLEGFEQRYPQQSRLLGRVLRVRIITYEHLGRLEDAEQTLPEYIGSDPENAGATLQALFESIREDVDRLRRRGRDAEADRKAASALLLARQIHAWASADPSRARPEQKHALHSQLAQALLQAKQYPEAERAFAAYLAADLQRRPDGAHGDIRAVYGHAESLYQLRQYEPALPLFHRVGETLPAGDPLWFEALLRDLQCRTELGHPPEGIIQVIRQQKFLHDDLGGPELRRRFEDLLHRNEKRMEKAGADLQPALGPRRQEQGVNERLEGV
ncbi:MAG: hypothetical protein V2A79_13195 [Planctomycetota bacterium]